MARFSYPLRNRRLEVIFFVLLTVVFLWLVSCLRERRFHVTVEVDKQPLVVYYRDVLPLRSSQHMPTVVFLVGDAFSSSDWHAVGTMASLSIHGYRAIAVDIFPPANEEANMATALILLRFLAALKISKYALVAPSRSCSFALPLLVRADNGLTHFAAISPMGTGQFTALELSLVTSEVLVIYGKTDKSRVRSWKDLKAIPNIKVVTTHKENSRDAYAAKPEGLAPLLLSHLGNSQSRK